jgi:hypothetical protein
MLAPFTFILSFSSARIHNFSSQRYDGAFLLCLCICTGQEFLGHHWHERMHWAVAVISLSLGKQSQAQSYIHHVILTAVP